MVYGVSSLSGESGIVKGGSFFSEEGLKFRYRQEYDYSWSAG